MRKFAEWVVLCGLRWQIIIDRVAWAIIRLVASVCVSVRLSVGALLFEPFDLWPWFLAWGSTLTLCILDCRSRSQVNDQGQTVKIVYALPFEPVVQSRSMLGLGLPSSANGNCEWPLPVHWNCLFVNNQVAFSVSHVSSRSALIPVLLSYLGHICFVDKGISCF